jgi:biopolymer transport protein ExbD
MIFRKRGRIAEGIFEVNMTPLIDVSLVLVVILMVATPMAFQSSIGVRSAAATGKAAQASRAEWIEITIVAEDSMRVNRSLVSRASLESTVRSLLATSPTRQVVVRCAERVSHGTFVSVLDAARKSGASEIAVMGR